MTRRTPRPCDAVPRQAHRRAAAYCGCMIRFGLLFTLVIIVLWIFAIFDSITSETAKVRNLQKPLWVIIVLLFGPILASGSIAWMIWGRPRVSPGGGGGGSWGGGGSGGRPTGPSS
ncbi:MAG: hypothetical protein JWN20_1804, partial [Jatrophihabitantaceae bacterium]|nr:hypothetical protein [Jatrophihabitantaceae bacterium]